MTTIQFISIQYRNAKYQGNSKNKMRDGIGILIDDNMNFYCSDWKFNQLDGSTLIFNKHGKYLYGNWSKDKPQGFNIFRSGDTVILANYENGIIQGEFMILFEKQNLLATVKKIQQNYEILQKREFHSYKQIKNLVSNLKFNNQIPQQYFSLIKFLKACFLTDQSSIRLSYLKNIYFFGYLDGIAIMFDDDNFVHRVGNTHEDGEMFGIGALYGISNNQEGNFATKQTIRYKDTRPDLKIQKLLRNQHRMSLNFQNNYVKLKAINIFDELQKIIKQQIISKIVNRQNQYLDRTYSQDELNKSLQYTHRGVQQGQRLRAIRQEIYQSIGRPGASIKPLLQERINPVILSYIPPRQELINPVRLSPSPPRLQPKFEQKKFTLKYKKYNLQGQIGQKFIQNQPPLYENLEQQLKRIIQQQQRKNSKQKKQFTKQSPERIELKKQLGEHKTNFKRNSPNLTIQTIKNRFNFNQNKQFRNINQYPSLQEEKEYIYKTPQKKLKNYGSYLFKSPKKDYKNHDDSQIQNQQYSPIRYLRDSSSENKFLNRSASSKKSLNSGQHQLSSIRMNLMKKFQQKPRPVYIPKQKSRYPQDQ